MKQYFKAQLQNMAQSEIVDMISADTLSRIKQKDPHPEFRAYVVGHEGEARPSMVGGGEMLFQYLQDAVVKLGNKIRQGISVFMGHAATNAHEGRKPIGEVVGRKIADVAGKLSAIAALYIYPEYRNKKLDVASIEADVEYSLDDRGVAQAESFNNITGIALGDGDIHKPAFPGATLLASLQAFQKSQGRFTHNKGGSMFTLAEIKEAIQEGKFTPSQLFAKEVLTSDQVVVEHVRAEKQTEYEHAKRVERKLQEERDQALKKEKDYETKIAEFSAAAIKVKSGEVLKNLITERKLDDKQKAFVLKNAGTFKTEAKDDDLLKLDLNKFVDGQLKEYDEVSTILGVKPKEDDKDINGDKGAASGDDKQEKDYEDPKVNPLMPGHEEAVGDGKK